MKFNSIDNRSRKLLSESVWQGLDTGTKQHLREWETGVWPLMEQYVKILEADLSPQQIQQLFTSAEEYAVTGGKFKTGLGKAGSAAAAAGSAAVGTVKVGANVMQQISNKINELGKVIQDTTPVQNADAAFAKAQKDLYTALGGKDSKVVQIVNKMSQLAKDHPGKTKFLIGVLTAAAAFAAGPAGGAAAGFLLRSSNELLKGEKLSTAVGKSAKTAAVGALAGMAFNAIGGAIETAITNMGVEEIQAFIDDMSNMNIENAWNQIPEDLRDIFPEIEAGGKVINWNYSIEGMEGSIDDVYLSPEQIKELSEISGMDWSADQVNSRSIASFGGDNAEQLKAEWLAKEQQRIAKILDYLETAEADPMQAQYKEAFDAFDDWDPADYEKLNTEQNREALSKIYSLQDKVDFINQATQASSAVAQGAASASAGSGQNNNESVNEAGLQDIKRTAAKAAGIVNKKVQGAGKELGQKVTAKKLMALWNRAGKPTDSQTVSNIIAQAGLSGDDIAQVSQAASVELPAPSEVGQQPAQAGEQPAQAGEQPSPQMSDDIDTYVAQIKKLHPQDQQKIIAALKKSLAQPTQDNKTQ